MRTQSVDLNFACNLACTFCTARRPKDDPEYVAHVPTRARIDDAARAGTALPEIEELVLTGGEPTMRRDLVVLARHAKRSGVRSLVLETNATLLDEARAFALEEAGVDVVRVHVPAVGALLGRIARDPDAGRALERGLRALAASALVIEVAIPIVRSNLDSVASLPDALASLLGDRLRGLVVHVPCDTADPDEAVSYSDAALAIVALAARARALGVSMKLAPKGAPPPCVFPARDRPSHLFSLSGVVAPHPDFTRIEACESCRARDVCQGFRRTYLERFGVPSVSPVSDERGRRRLALISSVEAQIARELVSEGGRPVEPERVEERIVRVNFHCNQACDFCFVSTHLPPPREDAVRAAIEDALKKGFRITLSGGEPTLNPRLPDYLRLATQSPFPVELQTNAVRLEDARLAQSLHQAGLRFAFVSLHAATAETGDAITRAPGTFEKTLRGLDNLHAIGVKTRLNYVVCRSNAHELPQMVELVARRWPGFSVSISFVARSTDVVPRDPDFLPRYTEVLPAITTAVARARALGVPLFGFESMCGLPLCLAPEPKESFLTLPELDTPEGESEFHKPEPCTRCALSTRCFGVRRGYVEVHGFDELQPVTL